MNKLKLEDFISKTKDGYNTNIDFAVVVGKINELVDEHIVLCDYLTEISKQKKHYWTEGLKEPDMIGEPDLIGGVEVPTKCFDPSNNFGTVKPKVLSKESLSKLEQLAENGQSLTTMAKEVLHILSEMGAI